MGFDLIPYLKELFCYSQVADCLAALSELAPAGRSVRTAVTGFADQRLTTRQTDHCIQTFIIDHNIKAISNYF
jgi:hypothetical protein